MEMTNVSVSYFCFRVGGRAVWNLYKTRIYNLWIRCAKDKVDEPNPERQWLDCVYGQITYYSYHRLVAAAAQNSAHHSARIVLEAFSQWHLQTVGGKEEKTNTFWINYAFHGVSVKTWSESHKMLQIDLWRRIWPKIFTLRNIRECVNHRATASWGIAVMIMKRILLHSYQD